MKEFGGDPDPNPVMSLGRMAVQEFQNKIPTSGNVIGLNLTHRNTVPTAYEWPSDQSSISLAAKKPDKKPKPGSKPKPDITPSNSPAKPSKDAKEAKIKIEPEELYPILKSSSESHDGDMKLDVSDDEMMSLKDYNDLLENARSFQKDEFKILSAMKAAYDVKDWVLIDRLYKDQKKRLQALRGA